MMTNKKSARAAFERAAIKRAEEAEWLPKGWWGIYQDAHGPNGIRVHFDRRKMTWFLTIGNEICPCDTRLKAINMALAAR